MSLYSLLFCISLLIAVPSIAQTKGQGSKKQNLKVFVRGSKPSKSAITGFRAWTHQSVRTFGHMEKLIQMLPLTSNDRKYVRKVFASKSNRRVTIRSANVTTTLQTEKSRVEIRKITGKKSREFLVNGVLFQLNPKWTLRKTSRVLASILRQRSQLSVFDLIMPKAYGASTVDPRELQMLATSTAATIIGECYYESDVTPACHLSGGDNDLWLKNYLAYMFDIRSCDQPIVKLVGCLEHKRQIEARNEDISIPYSYSIEIECKGDKYSSYMGLKVEDYAANGQTVTKVLQTNGSHYLFINGEIEGVSFDTSRGEILTRQRLSEEQITFAGSVYNIGLGLQQVCSSAKSWTELDEAEVDKKIGDMKGFMTIFVGYIKNVNAHSEFPTQNLVPKDRGIPLERNTPGPYDETQGLEGGGS